MKTYTSFLYALVLITFSSLCSAEPVNINKADAGMLADNIKGIGDAKAEAIIEYREMHGPFKSVDDLANVKGVGYKTIDKNRDNLMLK